MAKKTFTVEYIIGFCGDAIERAQGREGYGCTVRAKSRSLVRAVQRARKLGNAAIAKAEKAVIARGAVPAMTPVMDDMYVSQGGKQLGEWWGGKLHTNPWG